MSKESKSEVVEVVGEKPAAPLYSKGQKGYTNEYKPAELKPIVLHSGIIQMPDGTHKVPEVKK